MFCQVTMDVLCSACWAKDVGPTSNQPLASTSDGWVKWHPANVICQRWAKNPANKMPNVGPANDSICAVAIVKGENQRTITVICKITWFWKATAWSSTTLLESIDIFVNAPDSAELIGLNKVHADLTQWSFKISDWVSIIFRSQNILLNN